MGDPCIGPPAIQSVMAPTPNWSVVSVVRIARVRKCILSHTVLSKGGELAETTVYLGRMKQYRPRLSPPLDFSELDDLFLGPTLLVPSLNGWVPFRGLA